MKRATAAVLFGLLMLGGSHFAGAAEPEAAEPAGAKGLFGVGATSHVVGITRSVENTLSSLVGFGATVQVIPFGSLSVRYFFTNRIVLQGVLGFGITRLHNEAFGADETNTAVLFALGPRVLYSLVVTRRSHLYAGLGATFVGFRTSNEDREGIGVTGFAAEIPLGFEFTFAGLPNIGFSAELSLRFMYLSVSQRYELIPGDLERDRVGDGWSIIGGTDALSLLDFIIFGVHYYF